MSRQQLAPAAIADLVDLLAAQIEAQFADPDAASHATPEQLAELLTLAPSQLEDPKGHPVLAKLRDLIGQQIAANYDRQLAQAVSAGGHSHAEDQHSPPDLLCDPAAAQAFLQPIVGSDAVAARVQQAKHIFATHAALIDWDVHSPSKVGGRPPQNQNPDIMTFSDSDGEADGTGGKTSDDAIRRRSSSYAHLSRGSNASQLPARGLSLLLGSMDGSDNDLDLDFGPDVTKLVADLDTPELQVTALKQLTSSRVFAEDLCFGPTWQQLFNSLAKCLLPAAASHERNQAVQDGTVSAQLPVSAEATVLVKSQETTTAAGDRGGDHTEPGRGQDICEVRPLACQLLQRLVCECNSSSPQHAAHLLLSLELVLAQVTWELPFETEPNAFTKGGLQLLQLHKRQQPSDAAIVLQAHQLLASLAKDWHLLKQPTQGKVAALLCNLLGSCLQQGAAAGMTAGPSTVGAGAVPSTTSSNALPCAVCNDVSAGPGPPATCQAGSALHVPQLLLLIDPQLQWLQRLCSAASSCRVLLQAAWQAHLTDAMLVAMQQQASGSTCSSELTRQLTLLCAACLALAPQADSDASGDGTAELVRSLMDAFTLAHQSPLQGQAQGCSNHGSIQQQAGRSQQQCPCWVTLLHSLARSSPALFAGQPLQSFLHQVMTVCRAGGQLLHSLSEVGGGWWLEAAVRLLQHLELSSIGKEALLSCVPQQAATAAIARAAGSGAIGGAAGPASGAGNTPLVLSIGLLLHEAAAKSMSGSAPPLPPAGWACACVVARLLGGNALQLRRAGQMADAALRIIKFSSLQDSSSSGSLGSTARKEPAPSFASSPEVHLQDRCNLHKVTSSAGASRLAAQGSNRSLPGGPEHGASSNAADVLLALCGTPLAALQVCRRSAAAQAIAWQLCQRLAASAQQPMNPATTFQALAEAKAKHVDTFEQQQQRRGEPAGSGSLLDDLKVASLVALTTAGQQALIANGLPGVVKAWLETTSACPDLALALHQPPADCPALAPLSAAQSTLCWHRVSANLAVHPAGQDLLRLLVTWLDTNPNIKPPPSRAVTPAHGLHGPPLGSLAPSSLAHPISSAATGSDGSSCLPVRTPESSHLALRCFLMMVHDVSSLLTLDQTTNMRWYLQQLLDTSCGPPLDLQMMGYIMEQPLPLLDANRNSGSGGRGSLAGEGDVAGTDTGAGPDAAAGKSCWTSSLDAVVDMDAPAARYILARTDMLGPPPDSACQQQAVGGARGRGRPPSTPGALLDPSADRLAQVVRGDAGMCEPGVWLAAVREALLLDVQLPTLTPSAVALMLQRLLLVALQSPGKELQGMDEAAWAPTCQATAAVSVQFRGQKLGSTEVPSAQLYASWSCLRTALSVQPHQSLPGFSLDLALAAPSELTAAGQIPWHSAQPSTGGAGGMVDTTDPLMPFQLLGTYLKELQQGVSVLKPGTAEAEAAMEVLGMAPAELAAAHARLSVEVASSSLAGQGGAGLDSYGSNAGVESNVGHGHSASGMVSGHAGSVSVDWFLLWVAGVMGGHKPKTLDVLSAVTQSPAAGYWWPCFGAAALGESPRLALCTALQLVLESAEPSLWGACMAAQYHPCHAASRWLDACFFSILPAAEASKAMAIAFGLGPDYLVYCCAAMLKHIQQEMLQWQALYGLLPQALQCRLMPDFIVASHLQYMLDLERQHRKQVLLVLFPPSHRTGRSDGITA